MARPEKPPSFPRVISLYKCHPHFTSTSRLGLRRPPPRESVSRDARVSLARAFGGTRGRPRAPFAGSRTSREARRRRGIICEPGERSGSPILQVAGSVPRSFLLTHSHTHTLSHSFFPCLSHTEGFAGVLRSFLQGEGGGGEARRRLGRGHRGQGAAASRRTYHCALL